MKSIYLFIIFAFNISFVKAQDYTTSSIFNTTPIKIVAHTDSSVFLLGKKEVSKGKYDLFISKHSVGNKSLKFDTCLNFRKLFNEIFEPDKFEGVFFQCDNKILILFDLVIDKNKLLYAKWVDFNGSVSGTYLVDSIGSINKNFGYGIYNLDITPQNDILVTVRRWYFSGYQRDRCFLLDETLEKLWQYDFPKINFEKQVNIIADIDNNSNLVYFIADEKNILIDGYINNRDIIINTKVGNLPYQLRVRKDSLDLFFVNTKTKIATSKKVYYPFFNLPVLKVISSTQILLYNEVNIDDEKFIMPSKKGIYYERIDLKNNRVLLDTLFVFDDKVQQALTYNLIGKSNRPTNKEFYLTLEELIDGKIYSVFEHFDENVGYLELFACSFSIPDNKVQWVEFIPRKIAYNPEKSQFIPKSLSCFTASYSNKTFSISFFERKENYNLSKTDYNFNKFKMVKNEAESNFITHDITISGMHTKRVSNLNDDSQLFPWIKTHEEKRLFMSRDFIPIEFLYKNN